MNQSSLAFWSLSATELLQQLQAAKEGLTGEEAARRLARYGANRLKPPKRSDVLTLVLAHSRVR
jgi:P-type Mg2+ transporter